MALATAGSFLVGIVGSAGPRDEGLVAYTETLSPPGTIVAFAGNGLPPGWLFCNGATLETGNQYERLNNVLAGKFGKDEKGRSNVPDLRARVPLGANPQQIDPQQIARRSVRTAGEALGNEEHLLAVGELPQHTHSGNTAPGA